MTMVIAGIWECAGLVLSPASLGTGSISFVWVAIESPIGAASPDGGDFYELWRLTDLPKLSSALAAKGHLSPVVKDMDVSTTPLAVSDLIEWVVPWTAENYEVRAATTGELDPHAGVRVRLWHGGGTRVLQQDIVETAGSSAAASQATGVLTATPGGVLSKMEVTGRPAVVFLFTDRNFRSTLQNTRPAR